MASQFDIQQARAFAASIRSYWDWAQQGGSGGQASVDERVDRLETAQAAMDHLAWRAITDDDYKAVIREFDLVAQALTREAKGNTDFWCGYKMGAGKGIQELILDLKPDDGAKPPRLILLEAMHSAVKGELFRNPDVRGVVPWLAAPAAGGNAFAKTLAHDRLPVVWFATFGILLRAAVPGSWVLSGAQMFGAEPDPSALVVEAQRFVNGLPTMGLCFERPAGQHGCMAMPQELRATLADVATRAYARLEQARADAARAASSLPAAAGGSGLPAMDLLIPAASRPWYRDGKILAGLLGGVVGGAWFAARAR